MSGTAKLEHNTNLLNEIAQEMTDPIWLEGFADGAAAKGQTAPDMGRGHRYALGWITGRYQRHLAVHPSLSYH